MKLTIIFLALLFLSPLSYSLAADNSSDYRLSVSFDPAASKLTGDAKIAVSGKQSLIFEVADLSIKKITLNGGNIGSQKKGDAIIIRPSEDGLLNILYEATFGSNENGNVISANAISLTDIWYPQPQRLMSYRLETILPKGFVAVSEADRIVSSPGPKSNTFTFHFDHPLDHLTFIASSHYKVMEDKTGSTDIYAYFFDEDIGLAKEYVEHAKGYLDLYRNMIGPYPYARFSIVENIFPTGYSMPTYTLLGRDVVRLPFIVRTSLGHEILHQWFGNSVYIDFEKGNWAEGLTTYLADYLYEDRQGRGSEYRKQILIDYQSYVNSKDVFPLHKFRGRIDFSSKAIGYGKSEMFFHMLKKQIGDKPFFMAIKDFVQKNSFRKASWHDLLMSFEAASYSDLKPFFNQWLDRTDVPKLQAGGAVVIQGGDQYKVSFDIIQDKKPYLLAFPVSIYYSGEKETLKFKIDRQRNEISFYSKKRPDKIVLDEDFDLMRMLASEEFPPVISRLFGDKYSVVVVPSSKIDIYKKIVDTFSEMGAAVKQPSSVDESVLRNSSLIILGNDNPVLKRIKTATESSSEGFSISVVLNPLNQDKVIALINSESAQESDAALPKLFHYGKYSKLAFRNGRNIRKEISPSINGIVIETSRPK